MSQKNFASTVPASSPGQRQRTVVVIGVSLLSLAALLFLLYNSQRESRALRALPAVERQQLYERTRQTLLEACDPSKRPDGLGRFCDQQSALIVKFSQCDRTCQDLANRTHSLPRR